MKNEWSELLKIIDKLLTRMGILLITSFILSCLCIYNFVPKNTNNNNHEINLELVQRFNEEYSNYYYDQLANGNNHFEYDNDEERNLIFAALDDVLSYYYYCHSPCSEGHENCIEIVEHTGLMTIDDDGYKNVIKNALYSMNRDCSDKEMIEQINQWICDNLEYEITYGDLYKLFDEYEYKGQCYHYARLFKDMCNAVGINMKIYHGWINKEEGHSWNYCEINNIVYYFDVTWNDSNDVYNAYMFMTYEEFQESHDMFKEKNYDLY